MGTIVDKLYGEYSAIVSMMDQYNAISFRNTLNENFRKTLLLSAASHFESRITSDVVAFCAEVAGRNTMIPTLVKNKAVSRQYHTWFNWEGNNANTFFNMFGEDFRAHMIDVVKLDQNMAKSITAFLEIGRERNRLCSPRLWQLLPREDGGRDFRLVRFGNGFCGVCAEGSERFLS